MDVHELRAAFLGTEQLQERIRNFRLERVEAIRDPKTMPPEGSLPTSGKIVLHLIPFRAFEPGVTLDLSSAEQLCRGNPDVFNPIYVGFNWYRFNFDGFLTFSKVKDRLGGYLKIFRNGIVEAVDSTLLDREQIIPSIAYEKEIIDSVGRYLKLQALFGIDLPIVVAMTLTDVLGYTMGVSRERFLNTDKAPIDRQNLVIPEIPILEYTTEVAKLLRPCFDAIWNAAGWPGSINYDQDGNWSERRK